MVISVRNLLKISLEDIRKLKTNFSILFEDNEIIEDAYYKDIILFRHIIDFIGEFNIPITSELWVTKHYSNGYFTNKVYINMYNVIYRDVVELDIKPTLNTHEHVTRDASTLLKKLFKRMYETIDMINRELVRDVIGYVFDVEIPDILEIQFNKQLIESIVECSKSPSQKTVENTYEVLDMVMRSGEYRYNAMNLLYLSGAVSIGQVRQLLGARGYLTELDSKIFNIPMTNSFTLGFKNIYDAAIESRAGAKALYLSGKAIQTAEYMARGIQLSTMTIEAIHYGDCGRPTYTDFYVRPKEYDEAGNVYYQGDLPNLIGKRYLKDDGTEDIITKQHKHLEGKFIKLRSAVYCSLRDKKKICSHCLGEISFSVFHDQNLGHIGSTNATSRVTQSILSTKHLLTSAVTAVIKLSSVAKKFFMIKNNEDLIFKANVLNKKTKRTYLRILQKEAWGLDNVVTQKDIFGITVNKISRLSTIDIIIKGNKSVDEIEIPLRNGNRYAYLSLDLLAHIIRYGYETIDEDYYLIDVTDFNSKKPVLNYEKVEFDFAALANEFKSLLNTRKYKVVGDKIKSEYAPHVLVQKLFELLNSKLSVNIALLEIIVYAYTVQDLTNRNYDLGRNSKNRDVVGSKEVIDYRSLGASYNWDNLQNKVLDPMLYKDEHKPSHPMDVFFKPNEVVKYEKEED